MTLITGHDAEITDTPDAPREIAQIYADIRDVTGSSVVNLVFRRLAGLGEVALAVTWHAMRPAYSDGRLAGLAPLLVPPLPQSEPGAMPPCACATSAEGATLRRIVLDYDCNNRRNLIAFTALLSPPRSTRPAPDAVQSLWARPGRDRAGCDRQPDRWLQAMQSSNIDSAAAPLPDPGSLDFETRACLSRLDSFGDPLTGPPLASLYRHLTPWPDFLLQAEARLAPLHANGVLLQATESVRARAGKLALSLPDLATDPAFQARIDPVIGDLVRRTIPKMVPIGRLLGAMLLPAPEPGA